MANRSSYPDQFDTDLELPRADNGITEINGDVVNSLRDAVIAIQHALGIYPQGATASVADRLNVSLDSSGNLKTESLEGLGIATLPIYNRNIADTAAVDESKLDLDYSTAYLKGRYDSLLSDLNAINTAFTTFAAEVYKHYDGTLNTHDGYQIDLVESVRGADDIETAIHELDIYMSAANNSITDIYSILDTLEELPSDIITLSNNIETHQDIIHANVVSGQTRGQDGTQGNLYSSTFASTVFSTETSLASNALQVMRPNVARITGTTPKLSELATASKEQLRIQAGGIDRSYLDIDLSTLIPVTDLNDIIDQINTEARLAANHYPISAYNVAGRLVIAHNLPGEQFTIRVLSTVTNSAHDVLGFEDIVNTAVSWPDGYHSAGIGRHIITDMKPLLRIRYDHSSGALNEIYPAVGDLLDLFGIDTAAEARIICNIFAHDTDSTANGTYYITDVIGSGNIGLELNEDIPYGEFNIDIVADAINFESASNGQIYDIFVETADGYDGYGIVTKSLRAEYLTNTGVIIRGISKEFPSSGVTWEITNNDTLQIAAGGISGTPVSIPTNFRGPLKAYAPDNVGNALFEVIGNPSPTGAKAISPIIDFDDGPDKLYVASAHYAGDYGNNVLKFVTDRRVISDSVEEQYFDIQDPSPVEDAISELRSNGVIRGFDLISSTTTTLKVRGGRAVVSGKIVDVDTQDVTIDSFTGDTRLLALDYNGAYITYDSDEPGFSIEEITAGDSYGDHLGIVPIMEFGTTSTQLDGTYTDRRLIIANIDKRLLDIKNSFDTQIARIENNMATGLFGSTSIATTSFLPEYVSVNVTVWTNALTYSHNPFSIVGGGTKEVLASKGLSWDWFWGRFNVASSGVYMISVNAFIYHGTSGTMSDFDIRKNGNTVWSANPWVNSADDPEENGITILLSLESGDYIEFYIDGLSSFSARLGQGSTFTMVKVDSDDTNVSQITATENKGFTNLDDIGFTNGSDVDRRFDLERLNKESEFKSRGITYINIMLEATYSDESGTSPFGTSDDVDIEVGAAITTGRLNGTTTEQYVAVKSINATNLPANSVTEQYVASIPLDDFGNMSENILFDVRPRIRIINSIYVDGGTGGGTQPKIEFNRVRIITSGYNIAADILGQVDDGQSLSAIIQDRL